MDPLEDISSIDLDLEHLLQDKTQSSTSPGIEDWNTPTWCPLENSLPSCASSAPSACLASMAPQQAQQHFYPPQVSPLLTCTATCFAPSVFPSNNLLWLLQQSFHLPHYSQFFPSVPMMAPLQQQGGPCHAVASRHLPSTHAGGEVLNNSTSGTVSTTTTTTCPCEDSRRCETSVTVPPTQNNTPSTSLNKRQEEQSKKKKKSSSKKDKNKQTKRKYVKSGLYKKSNGKFVLSASERQNLGNMFKACGDTPRECAPQIANQQDLRVTTGFDVFFQEMMRQHPQFDANSAMQTWSALPEAHKTVYLMRAEQDNIKNNGHEATSTKRALNSYNIFCKRHFETLKKQHPDKSISEISSMLGEQYRLLTPEEKKKLEDQARAETSTPRLKRAPNAYNLFCRHSFPSLQKQNPNMSFDILSKQLAKHWNALSPEARKPFYAEAERLKKIVRQ